MFDRFNRFLQLVWDAYADGGILSVIRSLGNRSLVHPVGLVVVAILSVIEASHRHTTPSQFLLAVFYPAILVMWAALGSIWIALAYALVLGVSSGCFAHDGGEWFTYILPNCVQAATFCVLCTWLIRSAKESHVAWMRIAICLVISISFGAGLGGLSLWVTETVFGGSQLASPLYEIMLHWFFGDLWACILGLGFASVFWGQDSVLRAIRMRTAR